MYFGFILLQRKHNPTILKDTLAQYHYNIINSLRPSNAKGQTKYTHFGDISKAIIWLHHLCLTE